MRDDIAIKRQRRHANLRNRIGIGKASADGPAIARLAMSHMSKRLGEERDMLANHIARQRIGLCRAGLYRDGAMGKFDAA